MHRLATASRENIGIMYFHVVYSGVTLVIDIDDRIYLRSPAEQLHLCVCRVVSSVLQQNKLTSAAGTNQRIKCNKTTAKPVCEVKV